MLYPLQIFSFLLSTTRCPNCWPISQRTQSNSTLLKEHPGNFIRGVSKYTAGLRAVHIRRKKGYRRLFHSRHVSARFEIFLFNVLYDISFEKLEKEKATENAGKQVKTGNACMALENKCHILHPRPTSLNLHILNKMNRIGSARLHSLF